MKSKVRGSETLSGKGTSQNFLKLENGGYMIARHLAENDQFVSDFVDAARLFLGAPYLWGGVQSDGIDCSALVQISMMAAGLSAPRDSDMQMAQLGTALSFDDFADLTRGDLVFWQGHVGIMVSEFSVLHANAYHMQVVEEPFWKTAMRIGTTGQDILAVKRLPAFSVIS